MEDQILDVDAVDAPQPRPQSLVLSFFGNHVLDRGEGDLGVYSGSIIDVLGRVGTGEQAVRSTLTRMVNRGLLRRQREGRKMYFGLTPHASDILRDGGRRIWSIGAVNEDWDGTWTLLGFSLPESWQRQRHDLRSRLTWSGFGALYSGLWIAPGRVDVREIVSELGLDAHVKVFHARADEFTDIGLMIRESWDLEALAARYVAFDKRWTTATLGGGVKVPHSTPGARHAPPLSASLERGDPHQGPSSGTPRARTEHRGHRTGPSHHPLASADPIATRLRLVAEWLRIIRTDPRLPVQHLPTEWPARQAQETFRRIAEETAGPAGRMAAEVLETTPLRP
ncbi:PaaX family transcriptional regulator [Streptomyces tailanensis]|uniref:PaaX family transcriptional regulator n=1 Tax=Streptomyces tailanensis TaxID=2569858 RepID=UPI001FE3577E|nr:PaaX family transcriptional regulator C-terminal domain-containing protein [Streptomyces tailanensis]